MTSRLPCRVIVAALTFASPAAAAAAPPAGVSQAQALFDRGVADMEAGLYEKACPAIEASQRLEPMPGTLFTLAECEAQRGRVVTAMRYYAEYLTLYRGLTPAKRFQQGDRGKTCEAQLKKLDALAPRLTLVPPPGSGPEITVKRDGEVVPELTLGSPTLVDPGEHVITIATPGGQEIEQRITLSTGESRTLELTLKPAPPGAKKPGGLPPKALVAPPPPEQVELRPWRIGTLSAGGLAVAGIAVGTIAGVLAAQERDRANRECPIEKGCTEEGFNAVQSVRDLGAVSTIAFVAGGVSALASVTLLIATPSNRMPSITLSPTSPQGAGKGPSTSVSCSPFGITVTQRF